jgi:hypothetical protein
MGEGTVEKREGEVKFHFFVSQILNLLLKIIMRNKITFLLTLACLQMKEIVLSDIFTS